MNSVLVSSYVQWEKQNRRFILSSSGLELERKCVLDWKVVHFEGWTFAVLPLVAERGALMGWCCDWLYEGLFLMTSPRLPQLPNTSSPATAPPWRPVDTTHHQPQGHRSASGTSQNSTPRALFSPPSNPHRCLRMILSVNTCSFHHHFHVTSVGNLKTTTYKISWIKYKDPYIFYSFTLSCLNFFFSLFINQFRKLLER